MLSPCGRQCRNGRSGSGPGTQCARKAAHIVDNQFAIIDYRQAVRSGVAEELVADASEDAGKDFGWAHQNGTIVNYD